MPLGSRIAFVEKLVWHPAPFQSPGIGFGLKLTWTPNSSAIRNNKYLYTQSWSPAAIPSHGPTWYSHCAGITSAFVPLILIPAYKHAL